jgi:hypothetical protein
MSHTMYDGYVPTNQIWPFPTPQMKSKLCYLKKSWQTTNFFLGVTNNFLILYTKKNIGDEKSQDFEL